MEHSQLMKCAWTKVSLSFHERKYCIPFGLCSITGKFPHAFVKLCTRFSESIVKIGPQ